MKPMRCKIQNMVSFQMSDKVDTWGALTISKNMHIKIYKNLRNLWDIRRKIRYENWG